MRKALHKILLGDVPITELVISQKLTKVFSQYGIEKVSQKTGKIIKGNFPVAVAAAKRDYDNVIKRMQLKSTHEEHFVDNNNNKNTTHIPAPPRPGYRVGYIFARRESISTKTKGEYAYTIQSAIQNNLEYNREEYRDMFIHNFADFFGMEISILSKRITIEEIRLLEKKQRDFLQKITKELIGPLPSPVYRKSLSSSINKIAP